MFSYAVIYISILTQEHLRAQPVCEPLHHLRRLADLRTQGRNSQISGSSKYHEDVYHTDFWDFVCARAPEDTHLLRRVRGFR